MLLGELRGGRVAQGGAVVVVEQRGVGLVRESAAADAEEENGNCGNHAEHHREHRPGLGERQRSAQGATAAENEVCVLPDKVCNNFEPPCFGIPQGAVRPLLSSSSGLALACSRACTHASCPL